MKSNLFIFSFIILLFMLCLINQHLAQDHEDLLLFSSMSFIGFALTCRSWVSIELFFVYDVKKGPMWSCSSTIHWVGYSFPVELSWPLFENQLNINGLFLDSQIHSIDLRIKISILKVPQVILCTFSAENHLAGVGSLDGLIGREHSARLLEYFITGI